MGLGAVDVNTPDFDPLAYETTEDESATLQANTTGKRRSLEAELLKIVF